MPYAEISARMNVTTGTVASNLSDAEKAVRRRLRDHCAELLEDVVGTAARVH